MDETMLEILEQLKQDLSDDGTGMFNPRGLLIMFGCGAIAKILRNSEVSSENYGNIAAIITALSCFC